MGLFDFLKKSKNGSKDTSKSPVKTYSYCVFYGLMGSKARAKSKEQYMMIPPERFLSTSQTPKYYAWYESEWTDTIYAWPTVQCLAENGFSKTINEDKYHPAGVKERPELISKIKQKVQKELGITLDDNTKVSVIYGAELPYDDAFIVLVSIPD